MECSCASERRIIMSYISKIDPETAGEKEKEVIRNHLAQGYRLTNEKLTLLHNAEAFKAIEENTSQTFGEKTTQTFKATQKT